MGCGLSKKQQAEIINTTEEAIMAILNTLAPDEQITHVISLLVNKQNYDKSSQIAIDRVAGSISQIPTETPKLSRQ